MIIAIIIGGLIVIAFGIVGWVYIKRKNLENNSTAPGTTNLNAEQLQTETLLSSVADGVIVFDVSKRVKLINPAGADLIGWPADEALNINVENVVKLQQLNGQKLASNSDPFDEVMQAKQAVKNTYQLTSRDGKIRTVSLVISPVVLPPKYELAGAVAVMRDISRQHQEETQRAEFISTASHEMRTPVAAIEGYLALAMNDKVSKVDTKARGYLEKAHASTQHLGQLFQDLLTSAKAEDGRLSSRPVVLELGKLLEQTTEDLKFAAEKKSLRVEFVVGSSGPVNTSVDVNSKVVQPLYFVFADPDRLLEVVTNLFDNAVKYTDSGKITIGITGNNELVQFFVKDSGGGIAAEDIPHLFQKFYRVNNALTRTQGGTGLGLFISRKIVELYNGRIWVESEYGKGSTFYINLPRITAQKAADLQSTQTIQPTDTTPLTTKI